MKEAAETPESLGETGVLKRILAQLSDGRATVVGPGDDAAVLRADGDLVVTSDSMIEGPDFRLAWHSGYDLGWKLAATNLSDVAAMGARPIALTVAFACPADTPAVLLEEIARGLDAACRELAPGCGVVGGDLAKAPVLTANVTALGDMQGRSPVLRSGARPGHRVAYAGDLGLAGVGLAMLFEHATDADGTALGGPVARLRTEAPGPLNAQFAPRTPIALGAVAAQAGASSMLDVSDSLSIDAARVADMSGVTLVFDSQALTNGFGAQHGARVSVAAMLTGGEDHGLLATFPETAELPDGFTVIGEVRGRERTGPKILLDEHPFEPRGWDPYTVRLPGM